MRSVLGIVVAVGVLLAARMAQAGSASALMNVTARVTNACTISAGNLAFGDYVPTSVVPTSGTATLQVTCTLGAVASIALDQGAQPASGSTAASPLRQMANGSERLAYALYQDLAHLVPWGGGLAAQGYVGLGLQTNVTVYGGIAASQLVSAGNFSDVVTATVSF